VSAAKTPPPALAAILREVESEVGHDGFATEAQRREAVAERLREACRVIMDVDPRYTLSVDFVGGEWELFASRSEEGTA
jgi:hypothetical protein